MTRFQVVRSNGFRERAFDSICRATGLFPGACETACSWSGLINSRESSTKATTRVSIDIGHRPVLHPQDVLFVACPSSVGYMYHPSRRNQCNQRFWNTCGGTLLRLHGTQALLTDRSAGHHPHGPIWDRFQWQQ